MRISDWSSDVCSSDLARARPRHGRGRRRSVRSPPQDGCDSGRRPAWKGPACRTAGRIPGGRRRSEEHTSELQSLMRISYAVFCLKKKKHIKTIQRTHLPLNSKTTRYNQTNKEQHV